MSVDCRSIGRGTGLVRLNSDEFRRISSLIYEVCGINMPPAKKTMLEARLQKRLRALGLSSFREYEQLLYNCAEEGVELQQMINVVTTNKTEFFREPTHFDYLQNVAIPALVNRGGAMTPLQIWSAGCSTGEEPYSLAMLLGETAMVSPGGFFLTATDISSAVLEKARLGIYFEESIASIPEGLKKRYFLRSRERGKGLVRVVPELRRAVDFRMLNFKSPQYGISKRMDIVFCRNVIIYFDKQTQKGVLSAISDHIVPGGFLFLGHSESIYGYDLPLTQVASTVYRKI